MVMVFRGSRALPARWSLGAALALGCGLWVHADEARYLFNHAKSPYYLNVLAARSGDKRIEMACYDQADVLQKKTTAKGILLPPGSATKVIFSFEEGPSRRTFTLTDKNLNEVAWSAETVNGQLRLRVDSTNSGPTVKDGGEVRDEVLRTFLMNAFPQKADLTLLKDTFK